MSILFSTCRLLFRHVDYLEGFTHLIDKSNPHSFLLNCSRLKMASSMTLRSGRKVGEQQSMAPREAVPPREGVPPRERMASRGAMMVPSKTALWEMGVRVTFPLVELAAQIERYDTLSWEELGAFLYAFVSEGGRVMSRLVSEEGLKVYAYSVEWRTFINELHYKVEMALNKGYVAFLKERGCGGEVLGTEPGTRHQDRIWWTEITEKHSRYYTREVMTRAYDLPGYVRDTGRRSVRKAASGAGSD